MKIPWLRSNFLARRQLDRLFIDPLDAVYRRASGRTHWPPYSLRAFVGSGSPFEFDSAGKWFLDDFLNSRLLTPGSRVLDIGCGCGRLAYTLASDPRVQHWNLSYLGFDVDQACVSWCQSNITPRAPQFEFRHCDIANPSYNPKGRSTAFGGLTDADAHSFDLIIATSVFTHLLPDMMEQYIERCAHFLAPGGAIYASFFLLDSTAADPGRCAIPFPHNFGTYALNRRDRPTNAIAFREDHVLSVARSSGLSLRGPARYGNQDVLLLTASEPRP